MTSRVTFPSRVCMTFAELGVISATSMPLVLPRPSARRRTSTRSSSSSRYSSTLMRYPSHFPQEVTPRLCHLCDARPAPRGWPFGKDEFDVPVGPPGGAEVALLPPRVNGAHKVQALR